MIFQSVLDNLDRAKLELETNSLFSGVGGTPYFQSSSLAASTQIAVIGEGQLNTLVQITTIYTILQI